MKNRIRLNSKMTRRDFLKNALLGMGVVATRPWQYWNYLNAQFPDAERLGRVCVGRLDLRQRPSAESASVGVLYEDGVVTWLREVIGEAPGLALSKRWIETPEGYLYAPSVQPVFNHPNEVVESLPTTSMGIGFWAEVTVPWVDIYLANPPARSPWLQEAVSPRLYYSQVMWIDDMRTLTDGTIQYRVNEKYGTYGDIFWADARAFRPLTEDDISPISPEVEEKTILVDLNYQTLSCFEGSREVYFCRISSGAKFNAWGEKVESWGTPTGSHFIWRKLISLHMAGGSVGTGYDLPGIPWTCLFVGDGVAVHSTFWHNDYGTPRSHGCINASPEDAKFVFRWTTPTVSMDPGDLTISGMNNSTNIKVIEA